MNILLQSVLALWWQSALIGGVVLATSTVNNQTKNKQNYQKNNDLMYSELHNSHSLCVLLAVLSSGIAGHVPKLFDALVQGFLTLL